MAVAATMVTLSVAASFSDARAAPSAPSQSFSQTPASTPSSSSSSSSSRAGAVQTKAAAVAAEHSALEAKSLGELRMLARQKGLRGDTRAELVALLSASLSSSSSSNGSAASYAAAAPPSRANGAATSPSNLDARALLSMPLSQLRAVARTKGVHGSSKEAIIRELLSLSGSASAAAAAPAAPAPAAVPAAPPVSAPASGPAFSRQQLLGMSLSTLRALARSRSVPNANAALKPALISALSSPAPSYTTSTVPSPWASSSAPSSTAVANASDEQLARLSMAELRALGKAKGIRGDTKAELIRALSSSPSSASAPSIQAAASFAASVPTAQAYAEPVAADFNIPFQSDIPATGVALEPVKLASEVSALKQAMEDMQARDEALEAERNSLIEQANFLRNVLVGGIGLAVVPLLLPGFQLANLTATTTASAPTTTAVATSTVPAQPAAPPPEPAPVVLEVAPEDFCASVPSSLISPQAAKFCEALLEPGS